MLHTRQKVVMYSLIIAVCVSLLSALIPVSLAAGAESETAGSDVRSTTSSAVTNSVQSTRQALMYRRLWGLEDIHVRVTASGSLVRLSYRVVDAGKAATLNDKKATPYLIDEKNGRALQVPLLEKVGLLRQVPTPLNGREYWMAFSNKGRFVKRGSRVEVLIGKVRISGLIVE